MFKTHFSAIKTKTFIFSLLILVSSLLYALDTITIGDTTYTCQNTCIVVWLNGVPYVSDSGGGWIFAEPNVPD